MNRPVFLALLAAVANLSAAVVIPELSANGGKEQLELYTEAARHGAPLAMLALAHYNEHGIGMAVNRAEALRWYRKVLSSPSRVDVNVIEAAENGIKRLGGDMFQIAPSSTNGNYYLDIIGAQTNRESASLVCHVLRNKLVGKTLVFTNLTARYVQRLPDGGINLSLDIHRDRHPPFPRDPHAYRPYDFSGMTTHVLFDAASAQIARLLDRDEKIVRIEGTVVTNWPWQTGLVLKGISLEPADSSLGDPLPPFDAATITGDELLDYFKRQRRIRKWQFSEIQSRLVGRRLTFHKLRLSGASTSRGGKLDSTFSVSAVPSWENVGEGDEVGVATFRLSFATDSARYFARRLLSAEYFAFLSEVTGTFAKVEDPDDGWALQLKDVVLVPKDANLDIADDGKGPLSGDEIVRQVGCRFTPITKLVLCTRFEGREIAFTSGVIDSCKRDWTSNTIDVVCRVSPKNSNNGRYGPLQVAFTIPAERVEALRRTPIPGDLVVGLKGRIPNFPPEPDGTYPRRSKSSTLELERPEFSITWKSDVARTTGLENDIGERIVRRIGLCWQEVRQDQFLRLARQVEGRTIDFPRGKVCYVRKREDGTVFVTVNLEDALLGESVELTLVVPSGKFAEQAANLKGRTCIKNIHGVIGAEFCKVNNWEQAKMLVCLKDAVFEICQPEPASR